MKEKKNLEEYTFLDHLEELRWRIIKIIISLVLLLIISLFFVPTILHIVRRPISDLDISLNVFSIQGYFLAYLKVGLISSIIFTFPVAIYQMSAFVLPGLYPEEKKYFYLTAGFSVIFFIFGVLFSYFVLAPISFNFLYNFAQSSGGFNVFTENSQNVNLLPGLNAYVDLFLLLVLLTGLIFQLPLIVLFLAKIGLVSDKTLSKYRAHSFIIILIIAALITPPDIITQLILGVPMYLLFELSIFLARIVRKRAEKRELENYIKNH